VSQGEKLKIINKKGIQKLYITLLIVILIIAGAGIYYYLTMGSQPGEKSIKVGATIPLTGAYASVGEDARDAMEFAVKEINDDGGILGYKVELYVEDSEETEAAVMSSIINKLATREKVDFILTPWGNPACSEFSVIENYGIPYLSAGNIPVAEKLITENPSQYPHVFLNLPSYSPYQTDFPLFVQKLIDEGKWEPINNKFCIIVYQTELNLYITDGQKENLQEMGWELTFEEKLPTSTVDDWSSVLSKIRSNPPALIIMSIVDPATDALFVSQFLSDPTESLIFMFGSPNYPDFLEIAGANSDGLLHIYGVRKVSSTHPYSVSFKQEYGRLPSPYGILCYDEVYTMKQAMEKAGDPFDKDAVAQALLETDYNGVMGRYVRDPTNHLAKAGGEYIPFPIFQLWELEGYMISPESVKERDFALPPWLTGS
jgi:branched-chain amino acid transport system substrate-binding protein